MNPGLPEAYKEHTKLHIVKCRTCKHEFASRKKIALCSKCGTYDNKEPKK